MKLIANKRGSKYFVTVYGLEFELELPVEKPVKKTRKVKK